MENKDISKKAIIVVIVIIFVIVGILGIYMLTRNESKDISKKEPQSENNDYSYEDYKYGENETYPKHIKNVKELPLPKRIVYYHDGRIDTFEHGSEEYNKIIELNKKRNEKEELLLRKGFLNYQIDKERLKEFTDIVEYDYENYTDVYFNLNPKYSYETTLINSSEKITIDVDAYWVYVGYSDEVFIQTYYEIWSSANELEEYLKSIVK